MVLATMEETPDDYVAAHIMPTLVPALVALCRERPSDPRTWLAHWLMAHTASSAEPAGYAEVLKFLLARMKRFKLSPPRTLVEHVARGYSSGGGISVDDVRRLWCEGHHYPQLDLPPVPAPSPDGQPTSAAVLYTGMFSPVHKGHLKVAEMAKEVLLKRGYAQVTVLFSPHADFRERIKLKGGMVGHRHRLEMLRLQGVDIDPLECTDKYYGDSFHGLRAAFAARMPAGCQSFILYGADKGNWRRVCKEVAAGIGTLVMVCPPRDDPSHPDVLDLRARAAANAHQGGPVVVEVTEPMQGKFSSTAVRKLVAAQDRDALEAMVGERVASYMAEHRLYQPVAKLS